MPTIADKWYPLADGFQMPYAGNLDLTGGGQSASNQACIWIHGSSRTAVTYYSIITDAAAAYGSDAVLICPQFLIEEDIAAEGLPPATTAFWPNSWATGNDSEHAGTPFSSMEMLELMIEDLILRMPNLEHVTVTGHSAGGQLTSRTGAGFKGTYPVSIRHMPMNASSHMYWNDERPHYTTWRVEERETAGGSLDYRFGVTDLNPWLTSIGEAQMRINFAAADVVYMNGGFDTDSYEEGLGVSRGYAWQGPDRMARVKSYFEHVQREFGPIHREAIAPGGVHGGRIMMESKMGSYYAFEGAYADWPEDEPVVGPWRHTPPNMNPP